MVSSRLAQRLERVLAVVATLLYVALTIEFATQSAALWRDEANSVNEQAIGSWTEMWSKNEFDSFPLLWMLLLRGWMAIGGISSDAWLRVLGCLCSLALPAALWFAAHRLGRTTPLVALAVLTVNQHVIRWGASVRAWGLAAALAIVALVLVKEAADTPTRRRMLLGAGAAILSVQAAYQNAVLLFAVIAGCVVGLVWNRRWRHVAAPVAIGAVAAVTLLPYWSQMAGRARWSVILQAPVTLDYLAQRFFETLSESGPVVTVGWVVLMFAALATLAIRVRASALFLTITAVVATGTMLMFYRAFGYPTQPWYYLGLACLIAICCDLSVSALQSSVTAWFRAALAAIVLVVGTPIAYAALKEPMTNMHLAGARLTSTALSGDVIVIYPWEWGVSFSRYYSGRAETLTVPPIADVTLHRYDLLKAAMLQPDPMGPLFARIQSALQGGHRVWYLGTLSAAPPDAPVHIPGPPPLPDTGWNIRPYDDAWGKNVGAFIRDHSVTQETVNLGARGGRLEDVQIVVVNGWK